MNSFFFLLQAVQRMSWFTFSHYFILLLHLQIRNEKARRYLSSMRRKSPVPLSQKFPNADPLALRLLERLLAFDPKDRPSAEEVSCFKSSFMS